MLIRNHRKAHDKNEWFSFQRCIQLVLSREVLGLLLECMKENITSERCSSWAMVEVWEYNSVQLLRLNITRAEEGQLGL